MNRKNNLRYLILTITNQCNHSCRMCYYHSSINKITKELSIDEFKKISCLLPNIKHLMISGGEPFLRKDLPQICEIFYKNNNTDSIFIPTNGSMSEQIVLSISKILEIMPRVELSIMLSLEGREKPHDLIHNHPGAFKLALKTIAELNKLRLGLLFKKKFFRLSLNTVVTNQNIKEIIPLMYFVKKNVLVDLHTFSPMRGERTDFDYKAPNGKAFSRLFHKAKPYFKFYLLKRCLGLKKTLLKQLNRRYHLWVDILNGKRMPFRCQAGNLIGVIEPDGGVRLCELTGVIGNIRKAGYDFNKIWFSKEADQVRRKINNCSCTHACFINASEKCLVSN